MSKNTLFLSSSGNKNASTAYTPRIWHLLIILFYLVSLIGVPTSVVQAVNTINFTGQELLGKPEDTSITVNIVPDTTIQYHYQYGTSSGSYSAQTDDYTATGGQPHEIVISGLTPNTQYYYRMQYHAPGDAMDDWVTRTEHTFWTQRAQGSSFSFTVTADSHENFNTAEQNAMTNISNEHPDFLIDLGDTFITDNLTSQTAVNNKYLAYRKPAYFDRFDNSVPIFLASGNHENEEGWNLDDTFSLALASIQARKLYYPTPVTDSFYSGNTDPLAAINAGTYGDQNREDYYAWTWGDALFVVIDEFQYTMNLPYAPGSAGEGTDDVQNGDQWSWTLGAQQYQWFKQTLQNSNAKYKFVFSHQMLGGIPNLTVAGVGPGYVRGGCGAAPYFEWGGENSDGSAGFAAHRNSADFGTEPIHQLMVDNGVSAYFHGHDHQYVYETCDGIAYQEVPSPGMSGSGFAGIYTAGDHGTFQTVKILPNSGHLRISITPSQATVDYVSSTTSSNGTINYSYTIAPHTGGTTHVLTTAVSPSAGGTITPAAGTHSYNEGDVVNITASPAAGYTFSGWSGDCSGSGACSVTMDAAKSVTANFIINTYTLTVTNSGSGTGTVTSNPAGITCGSTCSADFNYNTVVALTPTPGSGSAFTGWGGACSGSGACSVTMTTPASVTATFDTVTCYTLALSHSGQGSDPIASPANSPGCSAGQYVSGAAISLSGAVPNSGWQISGWTGTSNNSSTASTNSLTMPASDQAVSVSYTIIPPTCYTLTISHTGQGSDPVASPLKSTACSTNGQYVSGEAISLSGAIPTSGWQITGWTGTSNNASTASTNSLTMPASAQVVSVTYTPICYALSLSHTGQGSNPVATPANSTGCSAGNYVSGEAISLSGAIPNSGWHISGWTGTSNNASTASTNSLSMPTGAQTVSVSYTQTCYALTISHTGQGSDPVASPLKSTACSTNGQYVAGEAISLSGATPTTGWQISGWTGTSNNSSTASTNSLTMPVSAQTVGVTYSQIPCYALTISHTGQGSDPVASPLKSPTCSTNGQYVAGEAISLSGATPSTGWHVSGWTGTSNNSSTASTNSLSMPASAQSVSVTYAQTCYALTLSHTGQGSDPAASPLKSTACSTNGQYVAGEAISLSGATATTGWQITGWTGTSNNSSTASTNSLSMSASATSASVIYSQIEYTLATSVTGSGSISRNNPGPYHYGDVVQLTPVPDTGWSFSAWGDDLSGSASPANITINGNKSVSATFVILLPNCYGLTLGHTGQGSDPVASPLKSTACTTNGQYVAGEAISLSGAAPNSGWQISGWTGTSNNSSTASTNSLTMPASSQAVSVTYTQTCYALTIIHTGQGSDPTASPLKSTACSTNGQYVSGEAISLSGATPTAGWQIAGWTGTSNNSSTASTNSLSMPASAQAVSVIYSQIPCYALTISHTGQGSDPAANPLKSPTCSTNGQYVAGQAISLSGAVPTSGSHISSWTGTSNDSSTASSNSLSMPASAKSVAVNYSLDQLTYNVPLQVGWNLVSFNLHPVSTLTPDVFSSISSKYDLVYAWDAASSAWLKYDPNSPPYASNLTNLDESMGFWIKMNTAATLVVSGTVPGTSNIALQTGWNLVSFPATANLDLPGAFSDHGMGTDFTLVYAYHASDAADPWKLFNRTAPAWANDLTGLTPGWGYWIKVDVAHSWDVTY